MSASASAHQTPARWKEAERDIAMLAFRSTTLDVPRVLPTGDVREMNHANRRLLLAFVLAPLAAPVAYVVGTLVVAPFTGRGSPPSGRAVFDLVIGVFAVGAPTAYAAALGVGAPTYFVLRALGFVRRWTLWLAGAVIGAGGALVLAPYLRGDLFSILFPWWTGALLGLVSAEVFWRILGGVPPGR